MQTEAFSWTTYAEMLQGRRAWKIYEENDNYGMNVLEYLDEYENGDDVSPLYENAYAFLRAGPVRVRRAARLAADGVVDHRDVYQSEHADFMRAAGADYVASKMEAIAANEDVWDKTVFISSTTRTTGS